MSVRYLYRRPASQRICSYHACRQVIRRNIDENGEGRLYHHGCLMNAKDETWKCRDCFATFDGRNVVVTNFGGPQPVKCCGFCGSQNIERTWKEASH